MADCSPDVQICTMSEITLSALWEEWLMPIVNTLSLSPFPLSQQIEVCHFNVTIQRRILLYEFVRLILNKIKKKSSFLSVWS